MLKIKIINYNYVFHWAYWAYMILGLYSMGLYDENKKY